MTTWESPIDNWLDGLRKEEQRMTAELELVRRILTVADTGGFVASTAELIRQVAESTSPNAFWTVQWLTSELCRRGWSTVSVDPENAVRAAVSRAVASGLVLRDGRGSYRFAGAAVTT